MIQNETCQMRDTANAQIKATLNQKGPSTSLGSDPDVVWSVVQMPGQAEAAGATASQGYRWLGILSHVLS